MGRSIPGAWRRAGAAALAAAAALLLAPPGARGADAARPAESNAAPERGEYEIKAAFLYKFALFVDWPASAFADAAAPITIGILGRDPFGPRLEATIREKTARRRAFRFVRCEGVDAALKAQCHLLFIAPSEQGRLPEILAALGAAPVLTVGDTEGFAVQGVMVNLVVRERSVRFEVNPGAASRAGLRLSSQLLDLAVPVRAREGAAP